MFNFNLGRIIIFSDQPYAPEKLLPIISLEELEKYAGRPQKIILVAVRQHTKEQIKNIGIQLRLNPPIAFADYQKKFLDTQYVFGEIIKDAVITYFWRGFVQNLFCWSGRKQFGQNAAPAF